MIMISQSNIVCAFHTVFGACSGVCVVKELFGKTAFPYTLWWQKYHADYVATSIHIKIFTSIGLATGVY